MESNEDFSTAVNDNFVPENENGLVDYPIEVSACRT